jgi:hypothetical protein
MKPAKEILLLRVSDETLAKNIFYDVSYTVANAVPKFPSGNFFTLFWIIFAERGGGKLAKYKRLLSTH